VGFISHLSACAWWYKSMSYLIELYQMLNIFIRCVQVVIVRPLSAVSSLVRFAEEPQMFAIEFNDGCPIHVSIAWLPFEILCALGGKFLMCVSWLQVYASTSRDSLLAAVRDVLQTEVGIFVPVGCG
jgi:DnaJ family protein C protein 13